VIPKVSLGRDLDVLPGELLSDPVKSGPGYQRQRLLDFGLLYLLLQEGVYPIG
jgi:hypothetical protein